MMDNTPVSAPPGSLGGTVYTPSAQPAGPQSSHHQQQSVTEEQLIARLRRLMKMNLRNMCYTDAIFFADKLLHLQHSRTEYFVKAVYDLGKYPVIDHQ